MLPLEAPDRVNHEIVGFVDALATSTVAAVESPERSLTQRAWDGGRRMLSALRGEGGRSVTG